MPLLGAFTIPVSVERLSRELLKYGVASLIAVGLVIFLAYVVYAQQVDTQRTIVDHATHSGTALERQLQLLRIICLNLADTENERALCSEASREASR